MSSDNKILAVNGGTPVRKKPMPIRKAFGENEVACLQEAIEFYQNDREDLPYQGHFENKFCEEYSAYMGGGYADAVATGTASVYVALHALDLPQGSEVILSPVTDSGPLNCILTQGFVPIIADAAPNSFNCGVEQITEKFTSNTSAIMAVHCAGEPLEIDLIVEKAAAKGIKVLEDCSQAPGAKWRNHRVGTFGDIAATSTMYRKSLISGSSGGLVYSTNIETHRRALACADRGKPLWRTDYDIRNPRSNIFPALNWNANELSCAIGRASLRRLDETIEKRLYFAQKLAVRLEAESSVCRMYKFRGNPSPFFLPIVVNTGKLTCDKIMFAKAISAEGIDLNEDYAFLVADWEWAIPYLPQGVNTPNAVAFRDSSFNLFVNENYGEQEVEDTINAIKKVENFYLD